MEKEFWTLNEAFLEAMRAKDTLTARKCLYRMTQLYPLMTDNDLSANKAILHDALALDKVIPAFNLAYFVPFALNLADSDWEGEKRNGRIVPSLGQRITNKLMGNLSNRNDRYIKAVMPFFRKALQINPSNKDNLRHLAQLYVRVKLKTQAINLYRRLLERYNDGYLYGELAELVDDQDERLRLLVSAIVNTPREAYRSGYRYRLAELLLMTSPTRAAYEIRKSLAARTKAKQPIPADVDRIGRILKDYTLVTDDEESAWYQRVIHGEAPGTHQ